MKRTAIVDFDGTIFSEGFLDIGLLRTISKSYEQILIISNNSSLPHTEIEILLCPYSRNILTPQILAKSIMQEITIECKICCSKNVFAYLSQRVFSIYEDINLILNDLSASLTKKYINDSKLKKIGIVGKIDSKKFERFVESCVAKDYELIAMNCDKFNDSLGIKKKSKLIGDLYKFKYELGKTSKLYFKLLVHYCNYLKFSPTIVFGDNLKTDGDLASLLDIDFEKVIFGKSQFSNLVKSK